MQGFDAFMSAVGRSGSVREALDNLRAEHGTHTSRWLADRYQVTVRTAQRWLSGQHTPGARKGTRGRDLQRSIMAAPSERKAAARVLRGARVVAPGEIDVDTSSKGGRRTVRPMPVTPAMRAHLDKAAEYLEAGDLEAAKAATDAAILRGYFAEGAGKRNASHMGVRAYGDGAQIL